VQFNFKGDYNMTLEQDIKALALAEIRQVSELKRKQAQQQCSAAVCKQNGATPRNSDFSAWKP